MATILLSAAGAAIGGAVGGSVLGLSSAVIGQAVGATLGRAIDAKILGGGSAPVEIGKTDRFRLTGAGEGAPIPVVHGRMRVAGHVIWASRFQERVTETGGSKGGPSQPVTQSHSYSVSLAVAVCEGEIRRVGRVWADGVEVSPDALGMRVYTGGEDQLPDPKIEAVDGSENAPAYRGIAYVVFEDLDLGRFGNRVPQFSFEVVRTGGGQDLSDTLRAVALIPGSGDYALATTEVHLESKPGVANAVNVNSAAGKADLVTSLDALEGELPRCEAVSLVVSWFGDDLRAGACRVSPKSEQSLLDAEAQAWQVSGLSRAEAEVVPHQDGSPVYGGTPGDASVLEAIQELNARGQAVLFYPFLLMDQLDGNDLPDPYTGSTGQAALPWRGRITTTIAPGRAGTSDGTGAADLEVAEFFGTAAPGDFEIGSDRVDYVGPADSGYRRFILHYAHLCALAGGVEAFCIGTEMRGLTQIRGAGNAFPAVAAFRSLAADVRAILGPDVKLSYAADWSEYFGYQPQDGSGDVYFHLDPLWADPNIDFIGIDNYMPLSDWRDDADHADRGWGSVHNVDYLAANVAGGEGFDWYYGSSEADARQERTPITDGAYGEPWVYRYKDLKSWWSEPHHERIGGVRQAQATDWVPGSKPFWFTEYGCAAIDKGTNQPNRFLDPKSSESGLPKYSTGARDDALQQAYYAAMDRVWNDPDANPEASLYEGRMVDATRMFGWAWDARPYPHFPAATEVWSDGENYARGHWLTGRVGARSLAGVIEEVCAKAGVASIDTTEVSGVVRGFVHDEAGGGRSILQPLLAAHAIDAIETGGALVFRSRDMSRAVSLDEAQVAWPEEAEARVAQVRDPAAETAGRLQATFIEADGDFEVRAAESIVPDETTTSVARTDVPLVLTAGEAEAAVERWLSDARVARDKVSFALAPSAKVGAGDVVGLEALGVAGRFRVDRIEDGGERLAEAVRVDGVGRVAAPSDFGRAGEPSVRPVPEAPVWPLVLDLPLLRGTEDPEAPFVAAAAKPWPGAVAVYGSDSGDDWVLETVLERTAFAGRTLTDLGIADVGVWDRGPALEVDLSTGQFASASDMAVFGGTNTVAIGAPGGSWEVLQFRDAALLGPDHWALSMRLRGQAGTEPRVWPAGSTLLVLDGGLVQPSPRPAALGRERIYRVGPAARSVDDGLFREVRHSASGLGFQTRRPVHLRSSWDGADLRLSWVRQTRIDGDRWDLPEVPLGEISERYLVQVLNAGVVVREDEVSDPAWTYTADEQAADGVSNSFAIDISQISDRVGPGPSARIEING